jgi:hypothetical protein
MVASLAVSQRSNSMSCLSILERTPWCISNSCMNEAVRQLGSWFIASCVMGTVPRAKPVSSTGTCGLANQVRVLVGRLVDSTPSIKGTSSGRTRPVPSSSSRVSLSARVHRAQSRPLSR